MNEQSEFACSLNGQIAVVAESRSDGQALTDLLGTLGADVCGHYHDVGYAIDAIQRGFRPDCVAICPAAGELASTHLVVSLRAECIPFVIVATTAGWKTHVADTLMRRLQERSPIPAQLSAGGSRSYDPGQ